MRPLRESSRTNACCMYQEFRRKRRRRAHRECLLRVHALNHASRGLSSIGSRTISSCMIRRLAALGPVMMVHKIARRAAGQPALSRGLAIPVAARADANSSYRHGHQRSGPDGDFTECLTRHTCHANDAVAMQLRPIQRPPDVASSEIPLQSVAVTPSRSGSWPACAARKH